MEVVQSQTRFLRRRALSSAVGEAALILLAPLFVVALLDYFRPLREPVAFFIAVAAVFAGTALAALRFRRRHGDLPEERDVALLLEEARPELMDSVICALELRQGRAHTPTPITTALLAQADRSLQALDVRAMVRDQTVAVTTLCAVAAAVLGVATFLGWLPLAQKVIAYGRDLTYGQSTAMDVTPGNAEVARGGDIAITAKILRGANQATITITDADGVSAYEMYAGEGRTQTFQLFGVHDDIAYSVRTPTVTSETFRLRVYDNPAVTDCTVQIDPPAYTGLPRQLVAGLQNFSVPQGAAVQFHIGTNVAVTANLELTPDRTVPFTATAATEYRSTIAVEQGTTFTINLTDDRQHRATTGSYTIDCVRDFPPIIQVLQPEEDAVQRADQPISFAVQARDDYGIRQVELTYMINGGERRTTPLFAAQTTPYPKEQRSGATLALGESLQNGDIISYLCTAMDNAEPIGNKSTTQMAFIEIRPEHPEPSKQDMEGKGQMKKLSVSDLIVEQKRLLRATWSIQARESVAAREELLGEVTAAATELRQVTEQRVSGLTGSLPPAETATAPENPGGLAEAFFRNAVKQATAAPEAGASIGVFGELFKQAIDNMKQAESWLKKKLPDESVPSQQQALSKLVSIEIELEKNPPPQGKGEGEGQQQKQNVQEKNREQEKNRAMANLDAMSKQLDRLIARQETMNDDMTTEADAMTAQRQANLRQRQDEIRLDAIELRDAMLRLPETAGASREVSEGVLHMERVGAKLQQGRNRELRDHGEQALQFLQRGRDLLDQRLQEIQSGDLRQAQESLETIRQGQSRLGKETQQKVNSGSPAADGNALAGQQEKLRTDLTQLLDKIGSIAGQAESSNPELSQELGKMGTQADSGRVSPLMKRSENALRYGRLDKSLEYQNQVTEQLSGLSDQLRRALDKASQLSPEQLGRMLERVADNLKALQGQPPSEAAQRQRLQQMLANDLGKMAGQLNDPLMDAIYNAAEQLLSDGSTPSADLQQEFAALLYRTATLLESKIRQSAVRQRVNLSRVSGQTPPDEYKKLVDEYFKNISARF